MSKESLISRYGSEKGFYTLLSVVFLEDGRKMAALLGDMCDKRLVDPARLPGMAVDIYGERDVAIPAEVSSFLDGLGVQAGPTIEAEEVNAAVRDAYQAACAVIAPAGDAPLSEKAFADVVAGVMERGREMSYPQVWLFLDSHRDGTGVKDVLSAQQDLEYGLFCELSERYRGYHPQLRRDVERAMRPRLESEAAVRRYAGECARCDALSLQERLVAGEPALPAGAVYGPALIERERRLFSQVRLPALGEGKDTPVLGLFPEGDGSVSLRCMDVHGRMLCSVPVGVSGTRHSLVSVLGGKGLPEGAVAVAGEVAGALEKVVAGVREGPAVAPPSLQGDPRYGRVFSEAGVLDKGYSEGVRTFLDRFPDGDAVEVVMVRDDAGGEVNLGWLLECRDGEGEALGYLFLPRDGALSRAGRPSMLKVVADDFGYLVQREGHVPEGVVSQVVDFISERGGRENTYSLSEDRPAAGLRL